MINNWTASSARAVSPGPADGVSVLLYPNIGAEETESGPSPPGNIISPSLSLVRISGSGRSEMEAVASLWPLLFPPNTSLDSSVGFELRALSPSLQRLWNCLPSGDIPDQLLVPWLSTTAALERARTLGRTYGAPPPEIVTRVHDKGFVARLAREFALAPEELTACIAVLAPEDLLAADASRQIEARVRSWPAAYQRSFTLKPRWGTSGRGRVAGHDGRLPESSMRALLMLAARGGAILEPWLDRVEDVSVQLNVRGAADIEILGSTRQMLERSGLYRGNAGVFGPVGALTSGSRFDAEARTAAVQVACAAAREGFRGCCGVDSFVYRDPDGETRFRSAVELNARVTIGTIALAAVRAVLAGSNIDPTQPVHDPVDRLAPDHFGSTMLIDERGDSPRLDWMFLLQVVSRPRDGRANSRGQDTAGCHPTQPWTRDGECGSCTPLLVDAPNGPTVLLRDPALG